MRKTLLLVAVIAAPMMSPADEPAAAGLSPLSFLAGACWRGEQAPGRSDTHCYEWLYGGRFLRDRHEVDGTDPLYQGETVYRVDEEGSIRWVYYASNGGWSEGTAIPEDGDIRFPDEAWTGPDGTERLFRSRMSGIAADRYSMVTEERVDGEWVVVNTVHFGRVDQAH